MGYAGCNVTYPCKQAVIPLLDGLSDDARALGAVNTVVLRDGQAIGHNTDWYGYAENFRRGLPDVARHRDVQFGAGRGEAAAPVDRVHHSQRLKRECPISGHHIPLSGNLNMPTRLTG